METIWQNILQCVDELFLSFGAQNLINENLYMYLNSILEAVGNTPLIKLNHVNGNSKGTLLAKVEYFNPGHSIKDRIAIKMIDDAEE